VATTGLTAWQWLDWDDTSRYAPVRSGEAPRGARRRPGWHIAELFRCRPQPASCSAPTDNLLTSDGRRVVRSAGSGPRLRGRLTRHDDEAKSRVRWRAANRYGAKVKWAEVDIEKGERLPGSGGESIIPRPIRLVRDHVGLSALGTLNDTATVDQAGCTRTAASSCVEQFEAASPTYRLIRP